MGTGALDSGDECSLCLLVVGEGQRDRCGSDRTATGDVLEIRREDDAAEVGPVDPFF